jgi:plastocyanin
MKEQFKEIKNLFKENPAIRNSYIALVVLVLALSATILALVSMQDEEHIERVAEIRITSEGFIPSNLSLEPNTRVIWRNASDDLHQVVSNPHASHDSLPALKSELLNNDQTYEYTFEEKGLFNYHDEMKPTANGVIKVE